MCEPTEYHEKRVTVQFVTNQGILREFTRHRKFSFSVESTRYCNYSKNKYEREITFIEPWFINDDRELLSSEAFDNAYEVLCSTYEEAEGYYMLLLDEGFKPEEARGVLPLDTKCEMIMTGFISDWEHFFSLRALGTTGKPHPQAKELAEPLMQEFKALNYIE
jgi:thymidylate synthase (FAD)